MKKIMMKVLLVIVGMITSLAAIPYLVSFLVWHAIYNIAKGGENIYSFDQLFDEIKWLWGEFVDKVKEL